MKNILNKTTLLFLAAAITLTACNRQEDEIAGKGGKATIKATPKHHDINIDSCTIHLKYNASDMPSSYDEEVKCVMENGKPVATFTDLKKGKYYLYGEGWDPNIEQKVVGGTPFAITEEKTYEINVPVTEGD